MEAFVTCLFQELCRDVFLIHKFLLFHMFVCWLLKGNVLHCVFEMKDKIKLISKKLQGSVQTSSSFATNLQAFYSKLQNWRHKVMQGSIAMFEKLSSVFEKTEEHDDSLKTSIIDHLQSLEIVFELKEEEDALVQNRSQPLWL